MVASAESLEETNGHGRGGADHTIGAFAGSDSVSKSSSGVEASFVEVQMKQDIEQELEETLGIQKDKVSNEELDTTDAESSASGTISSANSEKLAKLDSLLEKAGLYSSFLFSNMETAATVASRSPQEEISTAQQQPNAEAEPMNTRKRRRGGKKTKQQQQEEKERKRQRGEQMIHDMQQDDKLDTRRQPKIQFEQPKLVTGGQLRSYQLEGIRWLCNLFENGLNGILADEMGLGKTIQVIGLIAHLKSLGVRGPFLVVAPLSTLWNWSNEFHKWAPSIPCLVYHGNRQTRRQLRENELNKAHRQDPEFPVIITSYEVISIDRRSFDGLGFVWKYIIIDEGHRLKNFNCKLIRELKACRSENRLLLTGTPLQNNLRELWSLLNFILPDVFDDLELFESWFSFSPDGNDGVNGRDSVNALSGDKKIEVVNKLHEILRPFLLRRLKADVVQEMPSKTEIFVYCGMAPIQREYYSKILNRTLHLELEKKYGSCRSAALRSNSMRNRAMQLRKCCNHIYLFDEPTDSNGDVVTDARIVETSGKMIVLDQLLRELKRRGHKVLIFSQMTRMLDILEDFLVFRGYGTCRLDGQTALMERQQQMDAFNSSQSNDLFCFLLSTRAGGLGINLVAADTVIFFDSDWNPQQDNQAQDRCHRIGQKKDTVVYRLVTENSFENRMIQRAIEKRKLERVVIQGGQFKSAGQRSTTALTSEDLQELLRDDVLLRDGVETGGIQGDELLAICDRQQVVESFVRRSSSPCSSPLSSPSGSASRRRAGGKSAKAELLAHKGNGYEVVDSSQFVAMESFS